MLLNALENRIKVYLVEVDAYARLTLTALLKSLSRRIYFRELVFQFDRIGFESLFIVMLTGVFTGMVMALQGVALFNRFGATNLVGSVIGASIVRELGPVLAALMVAGRVGSAITAELGTMKVTEQIDAYLVEGTDVVRKLVVPRFLACLLSMPLLTVFADAVAILGGFFIISTTTEINATYYWLSVIDFLTISDVFLGCAKPLFFGLVIASISCHLGMRARHGSAGVGVAAKRAVVLSSVFILVSDFFLTKIFLVLFP
ncbi:transporter [Desulfuromonas versatilis]|uniref:Transporter n=1 Tax=Desulfuromonas versatilis TaxID=2802975 RepID=A0ABN6E375_9BACT|nr:ABC transporter permease [Desulfuromonas versatilis]BCR05606.1 transporter [Desulfuromonas versatilis]